MVCPDFLPDGAGTAALTILETDFLRYALGAGGVFLVVNVLLARALQSRKIRAEAPPPGQLLREISYSMRTILIFAGIGFSIWLCMQFGLANIYDNPAARGWPYFWLSVVLLIVLHDAWFYWTHRLIHHRRLFRRLHRVHHKSGNPSPFTAYSFDTGEAVINALYLLIIVLLIPVSELAIVVWAVHMILRNAIGHCGYELFPATSAGRPLFDWMTTVTHHDLHHAQARWNYGLYFTWWDRLMGTEHPNYAARFRAAVSARDQASVTG